jgi:hypothetical protein
LRRTGEGLDNCHRQTASPGAPRFACQGVFGSERIGKHVGRTFEQWNRGVRSDCALREPEQQQGLADIGALIGVAGHGLGELDSCPSVAFSDSGRSRRQFDSRR